MFVFRMFVKVGISDMQQIAIEQPDAGVFIGHKAFMHQVQVPGSLFPVEQTELAIGIPATMMDPLSAVVMSLFIR